MIGNLTPAEAMASNGRIGSRLKLIPAPAGLASGILEGRAGRIAWHGRTLIYLRRGRRVAWFEWRRDDPELPFPAPPAASGGR